MLFKLVPLKTYVRVCVCTHLRVSVVVDVAGRDHMTDGIGLHCHFLLNQQRQIHNLEKGNGTERNRILRQWRVYNPTLLSCVR